MPLYDDLFLLYALEMPLLARRRAHKRKQEWVNEILARRDRYGEFSHLQGDLEMNVTQHFYYFRMKKETFQYILDEVKDHLQKYNFRETISPAERLAVTLRYLATGLSFKALSMSYRISDATVGRIIHETCVVIWETLHNVHMPFPSEDEVDHIESEFWKKWKFPNCVGCIDGKHIRIKCPKLSGSMFYNYKHFFSIVLQAVENADYKFVCIDIGAYGKQSDNGIF
ncbi:hypothetical protein C0J52_10087 [Blattella germanica]|nr:hypothetical protein C0J52_10087 [Blattella germanica]